MIERKADGLIMFTGHTGFHIGLWARGKLRKAAVCAFTGKMMPPGALAYRPLGNGHYRYQRVAAAEMEKRIR